MIVKVWSVLFPEYYQRIRAMEMALHEAFHEASKLSLEAPKW